MLRAHEGGAPDTLTEPGREVECRRARRDLHQLEDLLEAVEDDQRGPGLRGLVEGPLQPLHPLRLGHVDKVPGRDHLDKVEAGLGCHVRRDRSLADARGALEQAPRRDPCRAGNHPLRHVGEPVRHGRVPAA